MPELFPVPPSLHIQSIKNAQFTEAVTSGWLGNINPIPIRYASQPRVRDRLTLRRLPLRRNPWIFGDRVFHPVCRYSCHTSRYPFSGLQNAPLLLRINSKSAISVYGFSPVTSSAQNVLTRPVSCYAFFKGWLLLSQPPGCFGYPTSFPT